MGKLRGNTLLAAVTALNALGFMQIGYDNGLMGGLTNFSSWKETFGYPGAYMVGFIVAVMELGAFAGSVFTSFFGEHLGRRRSIILGVYIMMVGAVLQTAATNRAFLLCARVIVGFGLGINNSTVPVMQAEFSPKATRGLYVCMQLTVLNFGILLVYWMDYGFSYHEARPLAWRLPCALQLVLLLPMLLLSHIVDESPRWFAAHDRHDDCLDVLSRLHNRDGGDDAEVRLMLRNILNAVHLEREVGCGGWRDILRSDSIASRRRFFIACAIQAFQQLGGINALIYYGNTLFRESIGFGPRLSDLMGGLLNTWFFLASFIPWLLIDRVGRKPLFLSMISVMAAVMFVQTALIYQVQNKASVAYGSGIGAAAMLFVFQGAFTIGFQATVWVYPSEILPLRLRQRGSSISTASNWICNFLVVQITPPAIANLGWRTYIIFGVLNALWVPIIWLFFPETKGYALEDVDELFANGLRHTKSDLVREEGNLGKSLSAVVVHDDKPV